MSTGVVAMAGDGRRLDLPDLEAALRLFDETVRSLEARSRRLEEVLTVKQQELLEANSRLEEKVDELEGLRTYVAKVLDAVASGVVAVDLRGRVTTANPAARLALQGLLGADPIGADLRAKRPDDPLWQVLDDGVACGPYQCHWPGYDGRERILAARAAPLCDGDGSVLGLVEIFEDVTDLRRLEEQLERSERLRELGAMAAGVAHEIRNPLNGIEGFASLLLRDLPEGGAGRRYATAIVEGTRHLNRTVTDLLAFTRPSPPQRRAVDPVALADECLELVRAQVDAASSRRGARETLILPELVLVDTWDGGTVAADPGQLRQVLLNLVQNACHILAEHRPGAGRVRLAVARDDEAVAWTVDDDGPGVPEAERRHIFTPFHSGRAGGTGLGLAVAHTLVQLHGGTLSVGDAPLGGARFTMRIPLA